MEIDCKKIIDTAKKMLDVIAENNCNSVEANEAVHAVRAYIFSQPMTSDNAEETIEKMLFERFGWEARSTISFF